jgi:uncharacterized protein YqeY
VQAVATEIEQKLTNELKDAMKAGDDVRRDAVRMLRAALKNEEIELRHPLTEDDAARIVKRIVKRHRESIDQFKQGNRPDLAEREEAQLAVVEKYVPVSNFMPRDEVEVIVRETVAGMDTSTGLRAQGAVMSALSPKLRGKADMKVVSEIVRGLLSDAAAR